MNKHVIVGLAVVAATLIPWTATATATGGQTSSAIDVVYAAMDGSGEFNVWGTLRCTGVGPVNLDVTAEQPSTGGVAGGGSNSHTCLAPGQTIKWLIDATGGPLMVDDPIVIQAFSAGSTIATTTETKTLNWGLPLSGGDD